MNRPYSLFALALLSATALSACGRSESVDTFKPDRAEEKVMVAEDKAPVGALPAAGAGAGAANASLAPQDQCASDATFAAYRQKLQAAVTAKNFDALKPLVDPTIKLDFGGGAGADELGKRLAAGDGSVRDASGTGGGPQWASLAEVMSLGCSLGADGKGATMPYAFDHLGDRDAFTTMMPRREGINLYETGAAGAKVVKKLGWDALTMTGTANAKDEFIAVKLDDGTTGFVARADARSVIDYRAIFTKGTDGNWLMTAFIAGD